MSTDTSTLSPPSMSAEAGYESEVQAPIRISGVIALLLGLGSVLAIVAPPMLLVPLAAMAIGFFALRKYSGPTPVGVRAAKFGLALAAGFGACGLFMPWMKTMTLGKQAEYFGRQYLNVIANGDLELALELKKHYVNRYMENMSLKKHYQLNVEAARALEEFGLDSINQSVQQLGPDAEWRLDRAIRVFHSHRDDRAEIVFVNYDRQVPIKVYMLLIYQPHRETGVGQWHVDQCTEYGERIVAPAIL